MKVCWTDLETTGVIPKKHAIVQAAFKVVINGEIKDSLLVEMRPDGDKEVSSQALEVNGLTREEINKWPSSDKGYHMMRGFFLRYVDPYDTRDKMTLAGFNLLHFDIPFLRNFWREHGDNYFGSFFRGGGVDIMSVYQYCELIGKARVLQKHTLEDIARQFDIHTEGAHHAMVDVETTRTIAIKLWEKLGQPPADAPGYRP